MSVSVSATHAGTNTLTLAATPAAGEFVVMAVGSLESASVFTVSGAGGTWTRVGGFGAGSTSFNTNRHEVWVGTGLTSAGPIAVDSTSSKTRWYSAWVLAGGDSSSVVAASAMTTTATALTGPSHTPAVGDFVADLASFTRLGTYSYTGRTPAAGWSATTASGPIDSWGEWFATDRVADSSVAHWTSGTFSDGGHQYRVTQLVVSAKVAPSMSLGASLRARFASIDVDAALPPEVSLGGVLRRRVGTFAAEAIQTLQLAATLRGKTASMAVEVPSSVSLSGTLRAKTLDSGVHVYPSTDVTNRVGGRSRTGHAVAEWSPAVVATPAHLATGHAVVRAAAYGPVTMQGAQPTFTVSEASKPRDRQRILIGGKDVTYFRDVATPDVDYQLADPLLWGPATVALPQVAAAFERPGVGALKWLKFGKQVVVQRVNTAGVVTSVDYRGVVVAYGASGSGITVECGGHAQGRAALREVPQPIFSSVRDVGMLAWRALGALGLELKPRTGPETGVEIGRVGGMSHLDYIRDLCVKAQTRSGKRWTIMPNDSGVYRMAEKDTTTVHATIFCDDARNVADLRRDMAEEPNRIFATGVSPEGKRIRFGVYPGLKHGEAPAYPFADGRTFGAGTTNAETTTGDGILVLTTRLRHTGYLSTDDAPGGYDNDCTRAVKHLQRDADLADTGNVNPATWDALFDLNVTGYSLTYSQVMPAAQRTAVRPEQRSASGAVIGKNPNYDRTRLKVDRTIDVGTGFWRGQIREWAWNELADATTANWVGTITLNTGAVLAGLVAEGAAVTDADVMDVRDLRPGMNVWLPQFDGGTLLHVSGIDIRSESVTLTVDTRARDALEVWEVITRNRETRNNPARAWRGPKSSTEDKDSLDVWDEVGGILYGDVDLVQGWNVVPIVAGQAGTVREIRVELGDEVEFACAVFGGKVSTKRLNHLISEPLTKAGTEKWEKRAVRKVLDERGLRGAWGTHKQPCGYSPGRKLNDEGNRTDHPLRGVHKEEAGFSYLCAPGRPVLYLAVWVPTATTLKRGRVMWNQLEGGL